MSKRSKKGGKALDDDLKFAAASASKKKGGRQGADEDVAAAPALDDFLPAKKKTPFNAFALLNGMDDADSDGDGSDAEPVVEVKQQPKSPARRKPALRDESEDEAEALPKKAQKGKGRSAQTSDDEDPKGGKGGKKVNGKKQAGSDDEDTGKRSAKKGGRKGKGDHDDEEAGRGAKRGGKGKDAADDGEGEVARGKKKGKGKKGKRDDDEEEHNDQPKKTAKQLLAEEEAAQAAAEAAKKAASHAHPKKGKGKESPASASTPAPETAPEPEAAEEPAPAAPAPIEVPERKKKGGKSPRSAQAEDEEDPSSGSGTQIMITSRGKKIKGKWVPVKPTNDDDGSDEEAEGSDAEGGSDDEETRRKEDENAGWGKEDRKAKDRKLKDKLLARSPGSVSPRAGPSGFEMLQQSRRRGMDPDEDEEDAVALKKAGRKTGASRAEAEAEEERELADSKPSNKKTARFATEEEELAAAFGTKRKKDKKKSVAVEENGIEEEVSVKKKSKSKTRGAEPEAEVEAEPEGEVELPKKKKKSKSKDGGETPPDEEMADGEPPREKKKKKKTKVVEGHEEEEHAEAEEALDAEDEPRPKKKEKKSKKHKDREPADEEGNPPEEEEAAPRKEKKSKKNKEAQLADEEPTPEEDAPRKEKKSKKKREKDAGGPANADEMEVDEPAAAVEVAPPPAEVKAEEPAPPTQQTGKKARGAGKASWRQKAAEKAGEKAETKKQDDVDALASAVGSLSIGKSPKAVAPVAAGAKKPVVSGADLGMGLDGDEMASRAFTASKTVAVFDAATRRTVGRGVQAEQQADGTFQSSTDHVTATGTSLSDDTSKDIIIDNFSLAAWGTTMVKDTTLKLAHGRKYGLLGVNGCGKSTLLKTLGNREVPIQNAIDIYLLDREFDATDMTAIEAVVDIVVVEKEALEQELEELLDLEGGSETPRFEAINERIHELDLGTAERRAKEVLHGLGFTPEMQLMKTREFSGGWRMRIALARALFVKPTLLLLDEPTNHLDLGACVWLEEYLKKYKHTLLMVSHSQDFLNGVCTDIIHLHNRKLDYYSGNYDTFVDVRALKDATLTKKAKAAEKQIAKMQDTVARLGQKVAKSAKSKEKVMAKKSEKLVEQKEELAQEKTVTFRFNDCGGGLAPPILQFRDISFNYPGKSRILFSDVTFGIDLESRVALVGPNGAGKSTLLKLMVGEAQPTAGEIRRHHHLRIARFHQHLTDQLDMSLSAVQYLCNSFKDEDGAALYKEQAMRSIVGRYGLTGKSQVVPMSQLSDGQKRRVVFAWLALTNPHLLLLDEPTNHLDIETIDALADAIKAFDGGVVLVSHDFRLIEQVAEEIWIVADEKVEPWEEGIRAYKEHLRAQVVQDEDDM